MEPTYYCKIYVSETSVLKASQEACSLALDRRHNESSLGTLRPGYKLRVLGILPLTICGIGCFGLCTQVLFTHLHACGCVITLGSQYKPGTSIGVVQDSTKNLLLRW